MGWSLGSVRAGVLMVVALLASLLVVGGAPSSVVRADGGDTGVERSAEGRYIVELDPTAVSPWMLRVAGDFGDDLRVHTVKSRVADVIEAIDADVVYDYGDMAFLGVATDDPDVLVGVDGVVSVKPEMVLYRQLDTTLGVIEASDPYVNGLLAGSRLDGSGWAVAVLDDGLDIGHPWFTDKVVAEGCYVTDSTCPGGQNTSTAPGSSAHRGSDTHGTHVAGIAVGSPSTGSRRGVAPGASLVSIRVFNDDGKAFGSSLVAGLERVRLLVANQMVSVAAVNLSLGSDAAFAGTCGTNPPGPTEAKINQLRDLGVITTVASGNRGYVNAVSWPACLPNVVPVGATDNLDRVAAFSNISAHVSTSGLVAPGVGVRSAASRSPHPSGQTVMSGTSMAAPHAAGAVALLRQAMGASATLQQVTDALRTSSVLVDDVLVTSLRRLKVSDAAQAAVPTGIVATITDTTVGDPVLLASRTVTASFVPPAGSSAQAFQTTYTTDPTGRFRVLGLAAGVWTASVSATGYLAPVDESISVTADSTATWGATVTSPTGFVTGTVSATPLPPAASFTFFPAADNPWPPLATTSAVNGDGTFVIPVVRIGGWELEVRAGLTVGAREPLSVTQGLETEVGPIELNLPTTVVTVSVQNTLTSTVVSNSAVTLDVVPVGDLAGRGEFSLTTTTDDQGRVTVPAVKLGAWQVTVSAAGFVPKSFAFEVAQADVPVAVSSGLSPLPGSMAGVVELEGETAVEPDPPGAMRHRWGSALASSRTVTLRFEPAGEALGRVPIEQGITLAGTRESFIVEGLLPGEWNVTATSFGYRFAQAEPTTVLAGQESTVEVRLSAVVELNPSNAVQPSSGGAAESTIVTVRGVNLDTVTAVTVAAQSVSRVIPSATSSSQLTVTLPPGSGTATLQFDSPLPVVSTATFTYVATAVNDNPGSTIDPGGGAGGGGAGGGGGGGGGGAADPPPEIAVVAAPSQPGAPVAVEVELSTGVLALQLNGVSGAGEVEVQPRNGTPPSGVGGLRLVGRYVEITARNVSFRQAEVCVPYAADDPGALGVRAADMRLLHFVGDLGRRDITTRVDTSRRVVCGLTDRFSPFGIGVLATERIAGTDRYATAVALSQQFFPQGAATVYLASGVGFADALAAGAAAAAAGAPVLLTATATLPASVVGELRRLAPRQVVIVGGVGAVSSTVETAVRAAVPGASVSRVAGVDRYSTAVEVSRRAFPTGATTVYVATGRSFPDALAGAAAAGRDGAPVLLVPGTSVPAAVATELTRLRPTRVVLLGGTTALSSGVATAVRSAVPDATVTRLQGADRYATAASVAQTFTEGGTVFVATGRNFPDALAGAAIAGREQGPVIVVPEGTLPASLRTAFTRLRPARMVVLGGRGALSTAVELQVAAFIP